MLTETISIVAAIQTVITVGALVVKDLVKNKKAQAFIDKQASTLKEVTPGAVELGEKALHGIRQVFQEVVQSPEIAARLAPVEHKLKVDNGKLKETTLYHLASEALLGYRRVASELTPDEIATVVQQVQTGMTAAGLGTIAEKEVAIALQSIEQRTAAFVESPLFQLTAALVATKAKLQAQVSVPTTSPKQDTQLQA